MAKLQASLADVSTEFVPAPPGVYIMEITDVTDKETEGRITYTVKSKIVEIITGDPEALNKPITDFISIHKADGSINQYGLIQLKRYFEAVLGKDNVEARGDDLDTDELKSQRFKAQVEIESYWKKDTPDDQKTEENKQHKNVFKAILPVTTPSAAPSAPAAGGKRAAAAASA
jgi:hypothetical protein